MKNRSLGHIPNYTADLSLRQLTAVRYMNDRYQYNQGKIYPASWYTEWCLAPRGCFQKCMLRYHWTSRQCMEYCDPCFGRE